MLSRFKPTWMIGDIYTISPQFLLDHNINCVLTDLDNTLVPWNSKKGSDALHKWLSENKNMALKSLLFPITVTSGFKRQFKIINCLLSLGQ